MPFKPNLGSSLRRLGQGMKPLLKPPDLKHITTNVGPPPGQNKPVPNARLDAFTPTSKPPSTRPLTTDTRPKPSTSMKPAPQARTDSFTAAPKPSTSPPINPSVSRPVGPAVQEKDARQNAQAPLPETTVPDKDNSSVERIRRANHRATERLRNSVTDSSTPGARTDNPSTPGTGAPGPLAPESFRNSARQYEWMNPKQLGSDKKSLVADTPFGPVTLTPFPNNDPGFRVSTRAENFNKAKVGDKYTDLVHALRESKASDAAIAKELLDAIEGRALPPPGKRVISEGTPTNAAAKLLAITHISEPQRFRGADKVARGALHAVMDGSMTLDQAFGKERPGFPMADRADYMRRVVNLENKNLRNRPELPHGFEDLGGDMTDSSDDEA